MKHLLQKEQQQHFFFWTNHENYGHSDKRCVPLTYKSIALSHWFKMGNPKSSEVISQTQAPEDVLKEE